MPKIVLVLFMFFFNALQAECFQQELTRKREDVLRAIGRTRLELIEEVSRSREIYRITQLLDIPSVGEKTVIKLGNVLGYWFEYQPSLDTCSKLQSC